MAPRYIDGDALAFEIMKTRTINSEFFANMVKKCPTAKLPVLQCEGYKMFHGVMRITPCNPKFAVKEIEADWLYKPEYGCWYGKGGSYPEEICERIG